MILVDIFNTISFLKHMHILQPFCIAVFLSLFKHNKTPKVFCLTFGVHVICGRPFLYQMKCQFDSYSLTSNVFGLVIVSV